MAYRTSKTDGRKPVHVEAPRFDELPSGMPAGASVPEPGPAYERAKAFTPMVAGSERTRALARKGAEARWAKERKKVRLLESLGLVGELPTDTSLHPFLLAAEQFAVAEIERLAAEVGAGHCPINASSLVQSASLQLASSRWLLTYASQAEEPEKRIALSSKLADASRQNLLAAHELTVRTAQQRPKGDAMAELNARLGLT